MSRFGKLFRNRAENKQTNERIQEVDALRGGETPSGHTFTHELVDVLNDVVTFFAPRKNVMAETLIPIPNAHEIVTIEVCPETSVALYMRLRAGEGIAGEVFQTGHPFVGDITPGSQTTVGNVTGDTPAHLYSTRSALAIPLARNGVTIGVLNVECPAVGAFTQRDLTALQGSELVQRLVTELATIGPEAVSQATIVENLLDRLRQKIAFAINPQDIIDTYYQILQISTQVVRPADVSGGLILVRPVAQNTADQRGETVNYAIRAARVGKFDSDLEWRLDGQSIAKRIINRKKGEIIPNTKADDDYRSSGSDFEDSANSELIVPLVDEDADKAIGVIGLVVPYVDAFAPDDLHNLEAVAKIAVYAIKRGEEITRARRQSEQLQFSNEILKTLATLFPEDMRQLTMATIASVRDTVSTQILQAALDKTASDHGAFVLVEKTAGQPDYLVMHERSDSPIEGGIAARWPANAGVTGNAYTNRTTIAKEDVSTDPNYIGYFKDVRSEIATPLKIGGATLGVLDVESVRAYHYTTDHIQWIEFLATQAAFALTTIDRAAKTHIELTLSELSQQVDSSIAKMQQLTDWREVFTLRRKQARVLVHTLTDLSGAWVGRFFLAMNSYKNDGVTVDVQRGQLYYLVSTDDTEEDGSKPRYFSLLEGVSGKAFREQRAIFYNDRVVRKADYPEYFDFGRDSGSGVYLPVSEGTTIAEILNIEHEREGAFTPDLIHACELAGLLASKLVSAAQLRVSTLLKEQLREYETAILRLQSADMKQFMEDTLANAAKLSYIDNGWGVVVLWDQPSGDEVLRTNQLYWMAYTPEGNTYQLPQNDLVEVVYPIFKEAKHDRGPVVLLDTDLQKSHERIGEPWPHTARSVICVPLLRPQDDGAGINVVGALAMASLEVGQFSEFDKDMLTLFAETIVIGLKNITLLQARKDMLRQVRHDFSLALKPLTVDSATMKRRIDSAQHAEDLPSVARQLQGIREVNSRVDELVFLFTDLMNWFFDLSNEDLVPETDPTVKSNLGDVVQTQKRPFQALAQAINGKNVEWSVAPEPLPVQGGIVRSQLIRAALFQYMDNAIKYGENMVIPVQVLAEGNHALIIVSSTGDTVPRSEWGKIFELYYRGSNVIGQSSGSGIGLFQVKEIATRLGGRAYYRAEPDERQNHFILELPLIAM